MLGRVIPSITQLEVFIIDVIIRNQDIKKLETTCFGLTLAIIRFHLEKLFCKSVIQLCKRALVLSSHHLRVWLDIAYSTGVKSSYYPDAVYLYRWGRRVVGWCLDSPCGGSITGSFRFRSQYQCGAILPADVCVDAVHRLYVWYYRIYIHISRKDSPTLILTPSTKEARDTPTTGTI